MNNPIDISALKAAALKCIRPTEGEIPIVEMSRRYQRFRNLTQPEAVLMLIERMEKLEAVATAARDLVSEDHAFEKTYSHCVTKTAFVAMRAALAELEDSP